MLLFSVISRDAGKTNENLWRFDEDISKKSQIEINDYQNIMDKTATNEGDENR